MIRVAIYIRTSTNEQNPDNQVNNCELINNYGPYELFKDQQSAWKDNIERDNFSLLKKKIKKRKFDHLIVWDLDRIYRNRKSVIEFFNFCKMYKCKIHSYRQMWLEDLNNIQEPFNEIMHDLMLQVMGWLAEEESNRKSHRVKLAVRKRDGKPTVSYKGNKWGRKGLSKQSKGRVMELHNKGLSIREIASQVKIYNKHGSARNISKSAVHKIILEFKGEISK